MHLLKKLALCHCMQLVPPSFSEEDASHGIISLIDRGFIPPGSQLSIEPPPVRPKMALLHGSEERNNASLTNGKNVVILLCLENRRRPSVSGLVSIGISSTWCGE